MYVCMYMHTHSSTRRFESWASLSGSLTPKPPTHQEPPEANPAATEIRRPKALNPRPPELRAPSHETPRRSTKRSSHKA